MKRLSIIMLLLVSVFAFNSCDEEFGGTQDLNYITFEAPTVNISVETGGSTERAVKVYTTQVTGADRTFNVLVDAAKTTADASSYVLPGTVTIPANSNEGELKVKVNGVKIGAGKKLVIDIEAAEGLFKGPVTTINIAQICDTPVIIDFVFDGYASETSWEIHDNAGELVASGGGYADGRATAQSQFCMDAGTYTFTVYDAYGDGLTWPNVGNIKISKGGVVLADIDGDFGAETTVQFIVP